MHARTARSAHAGRAQERVLAHQAQHAVLPRAHAFVAQARVGLAVAFAADSVLSLEVAVNRADPFHELVVGHERLRAAAALGHLAAPSLVPVVVRRPGDPPSTADTGDAIRPVHGGRVRRAHLFDLRRPGGRPASSLWQRS